MKVKREIPNEDNSFFSFFEDEERDRMFQRVTTTCLRQLENTSSLVFSLQGCFRRQIKLPKRNMALLKL